MKTSRPTSAAGAAAARRPALTAPRRAFLVTAHVGGSGERSWGQQQAPPDGRPPHLRTPPRMRAPGVLPASVGLRPGRGPSWSGHTDRSKSVATVQPRACCDRCVGGCVEAAAAAEQKQKQSRRAYLPKLGVVEFRRLSPKSCGFLGKCFRYKYDYVLDYRAFSRLIFNERPPGGRLKRAKDPNGSLITT